MSISYFYFFKKNFSGDVPFVSRCVTGDRFLDTLYVTPGTGSLTHFCDTEGPSGGERFTAGRDWAGAVPGEYNTSVAWTTELRRFLRRRSGRRPYCPRKPHANRSKAK